METKTKKKRVSTLPFRSSLLNVSKNRSRSGKRGNNRCRIYTVQGAHRVGVASSHLVRSSVEEKRGEKKRGEPRKTIKLQYKMPASETCLDRDYLCRTGKKRALIYPRAPRSLEFLRGQRQKLLFALKFTRRGGKKGANGMSLLSPCGITTHADEVKQVLSNFSLEIDREFRETFSLNNIANL